MKKNLFQLSALVFCISTLSVSAQLYWDIDGATPGAGGATPSGTWDTATTNWTTDASGSSAGTLWTDGNTAYFAADSDAFGSYSVTVDGTQSPGQITFGYGDVTLSGGTLDFPNGGTIEVDATQATINSVISGGSAALPLYKIGSGTLILGGNNTFSNVVSVLQGTLQMGASGDILPTAQVAISTGATLDLNNLSVGIGSLGAANLSGTATINLGSGTLTNLGVGGNTRYDGRIIGSGGLVMTGTNTLGLIGTNVSWISTFTGKTVILGGVLDIFGDSSLGTPPGSYVPDQITIDGGTLNLHRSYVDIAPTRGIYVGLSGGAINISSSQAATIDSDITGPGTLVKGGSGNVNLNATNTFAGGFIIQSGGLRFNSDIAAGTGPITVSPTGNVFLRNLTPPGHISTVTNPITVNAAASFVDMNATLSDILIFSGPISGAGPLWRGQQTGSSGVVVLSGDNSSWSGGLTLYRGTLALGHPNALGTTAMLINPHSNASAVNTVVLRAWTPLTGANAVTTPINILITNVSWHFSIGGENALELAGAIDLGSSPAITPIITVTNTGGTIFSGPVSGGSGIGLTKEGVDTLTLSGANTYDGLTTINAGTLLVKAPGSLAGGGVVVNSGGTLGGSGTVNGAVTVNSGGSIGAGSSPGILTLASGLDLSAGGTNIWELAANSSANAGTDFDQIVLTGGSLVLGGSAALQINFTGSVNFTDPFWGANHSWTIINGSNPGSSTFTSINGTNGITAGTFAVSADTAGVYLDYTTAGAPQPRITSTVLSGGNLILQGTNGAAGGSYSVLTSTNVALPLSSWTTNVTGFFTGTGAFSNGIPVSGFPRRFFLIKQP